MNKIRCAIVGLGRIGSMLEEDELREKPCTHAGAVLQNPDCILVGGCDIDPERRKGFSKKWNCSHVYEDMGRMLRETAPDILHIATPPETHRELVENALYSSVRLIICEKPLAIESIDASQIADYHLSGMVKILTNHERRYSRDYLMVKRRIANHDFGDLLSISSRIYMGRRRPVINMLLDDGTHLIDIIQFLTASELEKIRIERVVAGSTETLFIMSCANEIPVLMEIGSGRDHIVFELDLSFSSGRIRIGNGLYEEFKSAASPFYEKMNSLLKNATGRPEITGYFSNMLKDAVRCVRNGGSEPFSSAVDGYSALRFINAVKRMIEEQIILHRAPSYETTNRL